MDFGNFVAKVVDNLKNTAIISPNTISSCKSGDDFEICVVDAAKNVLVQDNIDAIVSHIPGSHAFPDIIIDFHNDGRYGIEVKSSKTKKNDWKILGNSIVGTTRDDSVIETYVVFGKTSKGFLDFRARKYELCVSDVAVTHSPRYLINMELEENETFFDKSGIPYDEFIKSEEPISLVTSYYHSQGKKAWWIHESSKIRLLNEISSYERKQLFGYGFAHFPELLGKGKTKYNRFALWLAEQKIITYSLRDDFSAGGRNNLIIGDKTYNNIPQIFHCLNENKEYVKRAINSCELTALEKDWNIECSFSPVNDEDKIKKWIDVIIAFNESYLKQHNISRQMLEAIML